ncbi:MAG: acyltransferase [Brevinematales bacterium]|jgi:hypothetical protein
MESSKRFYFMDGLRSLTILLVIVLHASLTFVKPLYPGFVHNNQPYSAYWIIVILLQGAVLMPIMFFASGYFMPASLFKKGTAGFIRSKLFRLGIPFIAGTMILAPLLGLSSYYSEHNPGNFLSDFIGFFQYRYFNQYHFWFLGILMFFFMITLLFCHFTGNKIMEKAKKPSKPSFFLFAGLFIVTAVSSFLINIFVKEDSWTMLYIIQFQTTKIPVYAVYFFLGIYAFRKGWFGEGYIPNIYLWAPVFLASAFAVLVMAIKMPQTIIWKFIYDSIASLQIMAFLFSIIALSRRTMDRDTPFLRNVSRSSYAVYLIHMNLLFVIVYLTRDFMMPSFVKFILQAALTVLSGWIIASLLIRARGLKAVLGQS